MDKISGYTDTADASDEFTEGDPVGGVAATEVAAGWLNGVQGEIIAVIEAAGLVPSGLDNTQVLQALLRLRGYIQASGTADAQAVTTPFSLSAYFAGLEVTFRPVAANTGACTLAVDGNAAAPIKLQSGADLYAGALDAGSVARAQYDGTNFVLMTPALSQGSVMLTYSGFSGAAPTGVMKYVRNGNMVSLYFEGATGTSNATTLIITAGFPDHLRPASGNVVCDARVTDNGVTAYGFVLIPSAGDVSFRANANSSFFTASGTKGVTGSGGTYIL